MRKMNFREELAKWTPKLRDNSECKIYIFATGSGFPQDHQIYETYLGLDLSDYIYAFIDNDPSKWGTTYFGKPVIPANEIDVENAVIIIESYSYANEISTQLYNMGMIFRSDFFHKGMFDIILKRFINRETGRFNNITAGGRCFIIGNGPSLLASDLDKLHQHEEISIGVNSISRIFDKTCWRPNYYFAHDFSGVKDPVDIISAVKCVKFLGMDIGIPVPIDDNTFFYAFDATPFYYDYPYKTLFSNSIERMYTCGSIVFNAIQGAVSMGYDEIYLLGIDHQYRFCVRHDGTVINNHVEGHHFYKTDPTQPLYYFDCTNIDGFTAGFRFAREYCDAHGIRIFNATRGGSLEVFERVDFDRLF